jgi:hypothetical protein
MFSKEIKRSKISSFIFASEFVELFLFEDKGLYWER